MADPVDKENGEKGETPAPRPSRKRGSRDPKVFVLERELSEVHLLLDNVSANPNTTVLERMVETRMGDKLDKDWIEQVCQITWPPDGSNEEKAEDAALLIKAKDHLNRLSHPASGSTIAFTLLVTQEGAEQKHGRRGEGDETEPNRSPTRNSLAQTAYPDLIDKAIKFRRAMWWISFSLVVSLLITCLLSWYVAYGNAALAELKTAESNLTDAVKRVSDAEAAEDNPPADAGGSEAVSGTAQKEPDPADGAARGAPASAPETPAAAGDPPAPAVETPSAAAAPATAAPQKFVGYCDRGYFSSAAQAQACEGRKEAEADLVRVQRRLAAWVCWFCLDDDSRFEDATAPKPASAEAQAEAARREFERKRVEQYNEDLLADAPSRAAALANIMGSAVLPFLYGLLGAGAAIIRSLSRKIRSSLLSPRDLHLSFQQLALGAVVGACIGLFVAAPGADTDGESLLGPVALSASAISFVAGFGVEAVFQALEALISRIFNIAPAASPARPDSASPTRPGG